VAVAWWNLIISLGVIVAATLAAWIAHWLLYAALGRLTRQTPLNELLLARSRTPARLIAVAIGVALVVPLLRLPPGGIRETQHIVAIALIVGFAWGAIALSGGLGELLKRHYRIDTADNLSARKLHTQVDMLRRLVVAAVTLFAGALVLMTFPGVRHVGTTLFASAGVAGLVVGMAARPALANLIAGVQIALTEPIRIDDVVIVDGEWGRIEEITTAYVVVRIWDLRRLVLPLAYFIEKPFQNWTRVTADLLGTVFLYVDYSVPVEALRTELKRVLETSGLWDGQVWGLQVTDATEHTMQLRALMSAPDAGRAWDLRCHVRERLIAFLQTQHPEALPRLRAEVGPPRGGTAPSGGGNNASAGGPAPAPGS